MFRLALQTFRLRFGSGFRVFANIHAGCNAVTHSGVASIPAPENAALVAKLNAETSIPSGEFDEDESEEAFATFIPPSMTQREEIGTHYAAASSE